MRDTEKVHIPKNADSFVKVVLGYNSQADVKMLTKAFDFAKKAHEGQKRASGEPYFIHPLGVAMILTELKVGSATLSAALLHDVVEETPYTHKDLVKEFGDDVASLVAGLTNLEKANFETRDEYKAENIRKILLATTKDVRIMLIKLADRLHNMRTLATFKPEKRKRIARETIDIYAPIATKLGMWWIKGELEDLSLRYLDFEVYNFLKSKITEKRIEREKKTKKIIENIKDSLAKRGVEADVSGRAKYFYSIYKKMLKKNLSLEEIYDLLAVRIITTSIPDCYAALGLVHETWQPVPRKFKDYIANPKPNGYQSLHTVVEIDKDQWLEIQIRTWEEHYFAEDGVAAHWRYKGTDRDKQFDKKISWLKQILNWRAQTESSQGFIETLKLDLFENEIVVFTPKGDPITLPEGSTPVDFAYEVHTSIGDHCSKANVNGKVVPLSYKLQPGEVVDILTLKNAKPSRQWLNFVMTSRARAKIKSSLGVSIETDTKKKIEEEYGSKEILDLVGVKGKAYPMKLSKCCDPAPGDEIAGFLTKDKKITIHKAGCSNVHCLDGCKVVNVFWKDSIIAKSIVRITMHEKEGLLSKVLNLFVANKLVMTSVNTRKGKETMFNIIVEIERPKKAAMEKLIAQIREFPETVGVYVE